MWLLVGSALMDLVRYGAQDLYLSREPTEY